MLKLHSVLLISISLGIAVTCMGRKYTKCDKHRTNGMEMEVI